VIKAQMVTHLKFYLYRIC